MRLNPELPSTCALSGRSLKTRPPSSTPRGGGEAGRPDPELPSQSCPFTSSGDNARFPQSWLPQDSRLYYEATSIHSWFLYNHIYSRRKLVLN